MKEQQIKRFIEQVKSELTYKKILKSDIIYQLINIFNTASVTLEKQNYSSEIENPLEMALEFYKEYNMEYYNTIIENIQNRRIIINKNIGKSFTDTKNNTTNISLCGNDGDLFNIVHELAHFIDRNSKPPIIPDEYWFLSETFAFYIEKRLENWLLNKDYKDLIYTRRNNRIFFENKMLEAIENQLYYENLYRQKRIIVESDIDIKKIKSIIKYDVPYNIVNYLLQYPLANILSSCLINNYIIQDDNQLVEKCINMDLYKILEDYSASKKIYNYL